MTRPALQLRLMNPPLHPAPSSLMSRPLNLIMRLIMPPLVKMRDIVIETLRVSSRPHTSLSALGPTLRLPLRLVCM